MIFKIEEKGKGALDAFFPFIKYDISIISNDNI